MSVMIIMSWSTGWIFIAFNIAQILCGIDGEFVQHKSSRIVSGWEARPGEHPHHANVRMVNPTGGVGSCDASIVHSFWALTAAHCLANQVSLVVRAGLTNMTQPEYISETSTFFMHPEYNYHQTSTVQGSDIALIKLEIPIVWSDRLKPIRVQSEADAFRNYAGKQVYASGFGRTWTGGSTSEVVNWVYLTAISNDDCFKVFGDTITETFICARYYNLTSQSICQGDDGGPLVHMGEDGIATQIGISAFVMGSSHGGCHTGIPAGFIRTGPFLSWMRDVTNENLDETNPIPPATETTDPPTTTTRSTTEALTTEDPTTVEDLNTTEKPEEPTETPVTETPTTEQPNTDIDTTTGPTTTTDLPEDESENSSEESEEDADLAELLKRMEVKVMVKVKMDKLKKKVKVDKNA